MNFPPDPEIREYASYYIKAIKIFKEEFKNSVGREPSEFELTDFSKMGIIPFGILKQNGFQKQSQDHAPVPQNSSASRENTNPPAQSRNQPAKAPYDNPLVECGIPEKFRNHFEISKDRVHVLMDVPKDEWTGIKEKFLKKGYRWDWSSKNFEKEGAKA
mgnify:CR=1 FL=1